MSECVREHMKKHFWMFSESHPTIHNRITYTYMNVYICIWCSIFSRHFTRRVVWRVRTYVHTCGIRGVFVTHYTCGRMCGRVFVIHSTWHSDIRIPHVEYVHTWGMNHEHSSTHAEYVHTCGMNHEHLSTHTSTCIMNHEHSSTHAEYVHTCGMNHEHLSTHTSTCIMSHEHSSTHVEYVHTCGMNHEHLSTHTSTCIMSHEHSTVLLAWLLKHTHLILILIVVTPFLSSKLWCWILGRRIAVCCILNDQFAVDPD